MGKEMLEAYKKSIIELSQPISDGELLDIFLDVSTEETYKLVIRKLLED